MKIFENFLTIQKIKEAESSVKFYTKLFVLYGVVGNCLYDIVPFFTSKDCMKYRTKHMIKFGIACKVLVRYGLPFKYDRSPYYELVIFEQVLVSILGKINYFYFTFLG